VGDDAALSSDGALLVLVISPSSSPLAPGQPQAPQHCTLAEQKLLYEYLSPQRSDMCVPKPA